MTSLESIVLPLEQSRALVEHGIVLDTALVWAYVKDANGRIVRVVMSRENALAGCIGADCDGQQVICGAPVLSELLDAIRAKVGNPLEERTIILSQDGHLEAPCCAGARSPQGEYQIAYNDTDLLAAAALLMEVSK